jgi:hypothetical protein
MIEKLPEGFGVYEQMSGTKVENHDIARLRDKINELIDWANSPARATDPIGSFMDSLSRELPEETRKAVYDPVASIELKPREKVQDVEAVIHGSSHEHMLWTQELSGPFDTLVAVDTNPTEVQKSMRLNNHWKPVAIVIGPPSVNLELGQVARDAIDAAQDVRAVVHAWFNGGILNKPTKREVRVLCDCGRPITGSKCCVCDNDE